ncbi:MAG: competence protein TfoX [Clostridiales bacterium]|nr:MAG: competence protein TfoX [Clostridiales bacterium]
MATSKEYHDYIKEYLSSFGDIRTRKMMGEYLVYYREKLIGNICDNMLFIKKTNTSKRLLSDCELDYPYKGSKTLMYVVEDIESINIEELLEGMYKEIATKEKNEKS